MADQNILDKLLDVFCYAYYVKSDSMIFDSSYDDIAKLSNRERVDSDLESSYSEETKQLYHLLKGE